MLPLPSNLQPLPAMLTIIFAYCDGVRLDLNGQLLSLSPQEKQSVLEYVFSQFIDLKYLKLSGNNLEILPDSISHLTQLNELYLDDNKLTSLPETLGHLTRLAYLGLTNNQLTHLPETFGHLIQLKEVYLGNNQLSSLTETLGHLTRLIYLGLSNNKFISLTETLGHLPQLIILNLSNNQLISLPDNFGNLTRLTYLGLSNNKLTSLPLNIIKLPDDMQGDVDETLLTFLPAEWKINYTGVFKPLKELLQCILLLDDIKQAKNFCLYSSLSKESYHLIKGKHLVSLKKSNSNMTAEGKTNQIQCHQEAPAQVPAPNSSSTSQPMTEPLQEFHYFTQLPPDLSKKILLHAATIPTSNHPHFMKGFHKHLSNKPSFNSLTCFLEEAAPKWRERLRKNYEEKSQKTPVPYR